MTAATDTVGVLGDGALVPAVRAALHGVAVGVPVAIVVIYCQDPGKDSIGPKGPDWGVGFVIRHEQYAAFCFDGEPTTATATGLPRTAAASGITTLHRGVQRPCPRASNKATLADLHRSHGA